MKKVGGLVALLLAVTSMAQGQTGMKVAGRGMAKGENAYTSIWADANNANTISLKVTSVPDQKVDIDWTVSCNDENFDQHGSKSGSRTVTTPYAKWLPIPINDPDECQVMVNGMNEQGRVVVEIKYSTR